MQDQETKREAGELKAPLSPPLWHRWILAYAAMVIAMVPNGQLMVREDGLDGDIIRIAAYAVFGSILPSLLILLAIRKAERWWLYGVLLAVLFGFFAWRGH